MDVGVKKEEAIVEKPSTSVSRGQTVEYSVATVTLPLKSLNQGWMPTFEVCTQRRLCCAPSVCFLRTILIL